MLAGAVKRIAANETLPKLDIGSGASRRDEDYITVDAFHPDADVRAEMWKLPFRDNGVEAIWCCHALEHAPRSKVIETLTEFFRVLRPGGRAYVLVPNFDYVARYWLIGGADKQRDLAWAEAMVYGLQENEGGFHKSAFNAELLRGDLQGVGFEDVTISLKWTHNQETLQGVGKKPNG